MPDQPRAIDHLVLPTASLRAARERLTALGFTVAPDALHPFGTGNCCVFFGDGTYLEPLAVTDPAARQEAERSGNAFVARDRLFRDRVGQDGFSAIALATGDAPADHQGFVAAGLSGGPVLDFSRDFIDAAGGKNKASFRLAFASTARAPEICFFTCQRINMPKVSDTSLQKHPNGAAGLAEIVAVAPSPDAFRGFFEALARIPAQPVENGWQLDFANARLALLDEKGFRRRFVVDPPSGGLRPAALTLRVANLEKAGDLLRASGTGFERRDGRIVIRPAAGHGAVFAFEEQR